MPAVILAVLLLALCVAVGVSLVQRLLGVREYLSYDTVATALYEHHWNDLPVLIVGIIAVVFGAVLLASALWPGKPVVLPISDSPQLRAGVSRAGLRSTLRSAAGTVEGVEHPRIRLRGNTVTVYGQAERSNTDGIAEEVCATLTRRVQEIGVPVRRVRARLRGPRSKGLA
ncbi:DUF6286 domain-containing protein [Nocardia sp. NPDC005366]|uniref:DUF6286 domain-containing protein n=1 Tax=Nocardia sp. NPDC005366 TaxID=3156878 RepID=UPI0033B102FF